MNLFVARARTALKIALLTTDLQAGGKVLLPNIICDVVLDPILQTNLIPVYYPVTQALTPDWSKLESIVSESACRALIMIHYFGQPQNIEQFQTFCLRHDLLLIEDNAHGYGGYHQGKLLGTFGDIGIGSPRKILGTPSGGVLYGASAASSKFIQRMKPFPACQPMQISKIILHFMPPLRRVVKKLTSSNKVWNNPRLFRESVQPDHGVDWVSKWCITSADWQAIAKKRRKSWSAWDHFARSNGLRPVFTEVHPESCPWAMPVYANDLVERNLWLVWGAKNGIPLFPWPSLPEEIILLDGDALVRWKNLICFPLDSNPNDFLVGLPWSFRSLNKKAVQ